MKDIDFISFQSSERCSFQLIMLAIMRDNVETDYKWSLLFYHLGKKLIE
jgi:hypothetical protein